MRKILTILFICFTLPFYAQDIGGQYYVAHPDSTYSGMNAASDSNDGSYANPFATWQKAVEVSSAGDTTYIRGGVYQPSSHIGATGGLGMAIAPSSGYGESGTSAARICYFAYPGETPILDGSLVGNSEPWNIGIVVEYAEYIHFKGITIRNMDQNVAKPQIPIGISCAPAANLIFDQCVVHDIAGRGWYYSSGAWNDFDGEGSPFLSDSTYWLNCDAYNLCDSMSLNPGNAADGWKCHVYQGGYLSWEGCRAWNYSDDAIDPSGAGYVFINNSWMMGTNKYVIYDIEGNGFKKNSPALATYYPELLDDTILVRVTNSLAVFCPGIGFYNNLSLRFERASNNAKFFNNTAYYNGQGFAEGPYLPGTGTLRTTEHRNNLVYASTDDDYFVGIYYPSVYTHSNNTWIGTNSTDDWPGWSLNPSFTVTDDDFVSVDSLIITSLFTAERQEDGSLPLQKPLQLSTSSDLIDGGVDVGLDYNGTAPDVGYSEYSLTIEGNKKIFFAHHSTGARLIADNYGGLGEDLNDAGYFLSDGGYGWDATLNEDIGSTTDIGHWWWWFMDQTVQANDSTKRDNIMAAVYNESLQDESMMITYGSWTRTIDDPGGENEIIMFKSCYPNSDILADNSTTPEDIFGTTAGYSSYTESNVRAVYDTILNYFKDNTNKMFVVLTAPPNREAANGARARAFNNWLVEDWLQDADWENQNVFVYDYYNVLTDVDNHHWVVDGTVVHYTDAESSDNSGAYINSPTDNYPNIAGQEKAASEFLPVLELWYEEWADSPPVDPPVDPPASTRRFCIGRSGSWVISRSGNILKYR